MAVPEFLVLSVLFLALKPTIATENDLASSLVPSDSSIVSLDSSVGERKWELAEREENFGIGEKSDTIGSSETKLELESLSGREHVGASHKQVGELETQVERLMKDIEMQTKKKNRLEDRASVIEKRIQNLNSKLEQLYKVSDEQENRIRKTEHLLQMAEEELMKAEEETVLQSKVLNQLYTGNGEQEDRICKTGYLLQVVEEKLMKTEEETSLHSKDLNQTYGGWLSDWLFVHFDHIQLSITSYWNESGKPVMDLSYQKGLETKVQVEGWVKLQTEMFIVDWIPILNEQWWAFITSLQLHVGSLKTNVINLYNASKNSIAPHASKILKDLVSYTQLLMATITDMYSAFGSFIAPHAFKAMEDLGSCAQKTKNFTETYMQHTALVSRSLLDEVFFMLKSLAVEISHKCGQFVKALMLYHHQVQETLKKNELVQPAANIELAWLMATGLLLAVPALFMMILYSALVRKRTMVKQNRSSNTKRRMPKQPHFD